VSDSQKDAAFIEETRRVLKDARARTKRTSKMPETGRKSLEAALNDLQHALRDADIEDVRDARKRVEGLVTRELEPYEKSAWREYAESIGIAILFALFLRAFVVEAFKIPSGSMKPTLLVGDHLFVNKFIYGIRVPFTQNYLVRFEEPERGEVVVFTFPRSEAKKHLSLQPASNRSCITRSSLGKDKDMIKRIIGIPGDTIEVRKNDVIVNGARLERTFLRKETTGKFLSPYETVEREVNDEKSYTVRFLGKSNDFGPIKVKPGHIFVMGDNRDDSSDSRCWGQVPIDYIKGRAMVIWWSKAEDGVRWERFGDVIR